MLWKKKHCSMCEFGGSCLSLECILSWFTDPGFLIWVSPHGNVNNLLLKQWRELQLFINIILINIYNAYHYIFVFSIISFFLLRCDLLEVMQR